MDADQQVEGYQLHSGGKPLWFGPNRTPEQRSRNHALGIVLDMLKDKCPQLQPKKDIEIDWKLSTIYALDAKLTGERFPPSTATWIGNGVANVWFDIHAAARIMKMEPAAVRALLDTKA